VNDDIDGNDSIIVKYLKDAAHHLELRAPNEADPSSVKDVRVTI